MAKRKTQLKLYRHIVGITSQDSIIIGIIDRYAGFFIN